jgi:hypothetical protein
MSLAEYEQQLKDQMTGYELKILMLKNQYMEKEQFIKTKCAQKFDMKEIAFREYKLMARKELD